MDSRRRKPLITVALVILSLPIIATIYGCARPATTVVSSAPEDGATGVPTTPARVELTFSEPIENKAAVEQALETRPSISEEKPIYEWSDDGRLLTVTYPEPFDPNTKYTVEIAQDTEAPARTELARSFGLEFHTASTTALGAGPDAAVTFAKDIKPLADERCKKCHKTEMSDYNNLISKKLVKPGDPQGSPYYTKAIGKADHPGGNVWKDKADLVKNWIAAGAPK